MKNKEILIFSHFRAPDQLQVEVNQKLAEGWEMNQPINVAVHNTPNADAQNSNIVLVYTVVLEREVQDKPKEQQPKPTRRIEVK